MPFQCRHFFHSCASAFIKTSADKNIWLFSFILAPHREQEKVFALAFFVPLERCRFLSFLRLIVSEEKFLHKPFFVLFKCRHFFYSCASAFIKASADEKHWIFSYSFLRPIVNGEKFLHKPLFVPFQCRHFLSFLRFCFYKSIGGQKTFSNFFVSFLRLIVSEEKFLH